MISAPYIIDALGSAAAGTIAVVDYLQLLDQKRSTPNLAEQVNDLKVFARKQEIIIICISQIDRAYEYADKSTPTLNDVRLPNPVDLTLFDRACFPHNGNVTHAG